MKIGCNWKRKSDKTKMFDMEFNSMYELSNFFESFIKHSVIDETFEIRLWEIISENN